MSLFKLWADIFQKIIGTNGHSCLWKTLGDISSDPSKHGNALYEVQKTGVVGPKFLVENFAKVIGETENFGNFGFSKHGVKVC